MIRPDSNTIMELAQQYSVIPICRYDFNGLQFHPESILTPDGEIIVNNFLRIQGGIDND